MSDESRFNQLLHLTKTVEVLTKDSEGFDDGSDFLVGVYDEGLDDDVDVSLS